jgi:hypothetical protein
LSGILHDRLHGHLFPGDGLEAAAILLCTKTPGPRLRLIAREAVLVPHAACERRRDFITWPGAWVERAIDQAEVDNLALVLTHSHPGGLFAFSAIDDESDRRVVPGLFQAHGDLHGTAIMTPGGAMRSRLYEAEGRGFPVELTSVAGHDLQFWWESEASSSGAMSRPLAFTSGMRNELRRLTAVVIGVSGTGSIVAEQLARLGFGRVILIDFDRVEHRNLNRILNARTLDAEQRSLKAEMFAEAVKGYRGPDVAHPITQSILTREAVLAASQGDVLFSCVDTLEARHVADLISAAFLIPLFDVGVTIPLRKVGQGAAIGDVCGRIDYVQPGGATLQDRGVYTPETLRAEYIRRTAPEAHRQELAAGYIKGLAEQAPSVISLNMRAAAACANELLARAYPFRQEPNSLYARTQFSLAACEEEYMKEEAFTAAANPILGRGGQEPLLGLPALAAPRVN